ncbi:MAG: glycoside hydrolase N-terminal domain-containing protein [Thermomicrobiales bacterium]|nr:glycoside hydrolase N-terminal domain-containing protein [Thermomicrobiales bacterium]
MSVVILGICSAEEPTPATVDHRPSVARSDLVYDKPASTPDAGQPIGNGRMGTMVWTSPDAIHLQINRADVFAVNCNHQGLPGQRGSATDYCGGIAKVMIQVGGEPFDAGEGNFRQQLSLENAECTIETADIVARMFVSAGTDVLVLEIDDRRGSPQPLQVTVSMLRQPEVRAGENLASTIFAENRQRIVLHQRFREREYYNASALVVGVPGNDPAANDAAQIDPTSATTRTLILPPAHGKRVVLISSAASWQAADDPSARAASLFEKAASQSVIELREAHHKWWGDFWSRTFVDLSSDDGQAQRAQRWRDLHLYHMASSSRGELPPKWNGSLFVTSGDQRRWGSQYWVWTTEMLYFPLLAADAIDLTEPFFNMYVKQLPNCERAAKQRWGVSGAYFPETTAFDGPTVLPDDVAAEFQDVLLGRKPHAELTPRAKGLCQFDSQLNVVTEPYKGRFSWISHVASSGSELAIHAWWRYRYTGDQEWLRTHAYPLLRGTVEFYRHLVRKEADGRYHLSGTHAHEDFWGVKDSIMDLAAIRGTAPLAIRAAEILDVDPDLRRRWKELLENLAPYPMGNAPQAKALTGGALAEDVWAAGYLGEMDGQHNPEDVWLTPVFPFEDWTLETRNVATDPIVQKLVDLGPRHKSVLGGAGTNTAIRSAIAAVRAGRGEELPTILDRYAAAFSPLPNGMSLFEGPTAASVEHLGLLTTTLQDALLQSVSARPGEPEVIHVFPAWPKNWNASFRLLARGGFLVSSKFDRGAVLQIEIESRRGEECRVRNPWDIACVVQEIDGPSRVVEGSLISFPTTSGKRYMVRLEK